MATLNKGRRPTPVEEYTIRSEPLRLTTNSQRVSSKTPHLKPQRVSFLENRSASRLKPPCFRETETSSPRSDRNVLEKKQKPLLLAATEMFLVVAAVLRRWSAFKFLFYGLKLASHRVDP